MIEVWNVFTGAGENSHQWIEALFFHHWEEVMDDGEKKVAIFWGQAGAYNTEPHASQGPCPLRAATLSCYWNL
jgi:hypothetical protein